VSDDGGGGPLIPVIDVALVHADAARAKAMEARRRFSRKSVIVFSKCHLA
jgi:hypothetical protein